MNLAKVLVTIDMTKGRQPQNLHVSRIKRLSRGRTGNNNMKGEIKAFRDTRCAGSVKEILKMVR